MEEIKGMGPSHKVVLEGRRVATLTGVKDVWSFDLHEVLLETDAGMLSIKGNDLHVSRLSLDRGEVDVDGLVDSFIYSQASGGGKRGDSLFSRLFG